MQTHILVIVTNYNPYNLQITSKLVIIYKFISRVWLCELVQLDRPTITNS